MHQWELQHSMAPYALDGSLHGRHPPLDTLINLPIHQVWPLPLLFYSNFWKIIDMPWMKINNCHMRNKCIWRVYQWPRKRKMLFSFVPSSDTIRLGPLKALLKLTQCRTLRTLNLTSYVTSGTTGDTMTRSSVTLIGLSPQPILKRQFLKKKWLSQTYYSSGHYPSSQNTGRNSKLCAVLDSFPWP